MKMRARVNVRASVRIELVGPRGPVSSNGRTWPEPNGSGRRGSAANGSGIRV